MARNVVGASIDEALVTTDDGSRLTWNGVLSVDDTLFAYESMDFMRGFMESVDDFFELDPETVELYWMVHKLVDELLPGDAVTGAAVRNWTFYEQLQAATAVGAIRATYPAVADAIEVDLDTGMAHLVRDNLSSEMGLGEEVTSD